MSHYGEISKITFPGGDDFGKRVCHEVDTKMKKLEIYP